MSFMNFILSFRILSFRIENNIRCKSILKIDRFAKKNDLCYIFIHVNKTSKIECG